MNLRALAPHLAAAALVSALAVDRLVDLGQPLTYDQVTQRVLNATWPLSDLLAGRYADARHPPLGYLVLHPFAVTSLDLTWVRIPTVAASLAALVALWAFARRVLSPWMALVPVALHGLSLAWLSESRAISDLPLFVLLALISSTALLDSLRAPRPLPLTTWALTAAAMCWTWFLAPVVLAAQLAAFALSRPAAWRRWAAAISVSLLLAAPMAPRLVAVILEDTQIRQMAADDPDHVWGDRSPLQLLTDTTKVVAASPWSASALLILLLVGGVRLLRADRRAEATLTVGLPLLALVVTAAATRHVRLQPYYLMFAVPFALVGAAAALDRARWLGPVLTAALLADAGRAYTIGLPKVLHPPPGDDFPGAAAVLAAGPPDALIVAEAHYLASTLAWTTLADPAAAWRACRLDPDRLGQRCGDRLVLLRLTSRLHPGWQTDDVARLRALRDRDLWFVEHLPFPNPHVHAELTDTCEPRAELRGLRIWWCAARFTPPAN